MKRLATLLLLLAPLTAPAANPEVANLLDRFAKAKPSAKAMGFYSLDWEPTLAAAQGHFIDGDFKQAKIFAQRAKVGLKQGSPEWIKAEDIITFKPPQEG